MALKADNVDVKVVLLGREYSGKTSLAHRYHRLGFNERLSYQATIGAAYGARYFDIGDRTIGIGLWDTAGSERYESMSRVYYRGAWAALVCFELIDRDSWLRARYWINEVSRFAEGCKIYLIGTKVDLFEADPDARRIDYSVAQSYADDVNAKYIETSSKTGHNVDELFDMLATDYVEDCTRRAKEEKDRERIRLEAESEKKKKDFFDRCC